MKILLVSDTHGNQQLLLEALEKIPNDIDLVLHLGDGYDDTTLISSLVDAELIGVRGNCDMVSSFPCEAVLSLEGITLCAVHGHEYQVKSGFTQLEKHAEAIGADLVVYGHTHIARFEEVNGIRYLNPGSLWRAVTPPSCAVVEIINGQINAEILPVGGDS